MVECEFGYEDKLYEIKIVLIDTWWNVNELPQEIACYEGNRFNRYMVECELNY